jgi:hypothetical protein
MTWVWARPTVAEPPPDPPPAPDPEDSFTLVVLPDTQYYSASYPATFDAQAQWILDNRVARNIVGVMHLGDIVDNYQDEAQWIEADASMALLDGVVRYITAHGNHDQYISSGSFHPTYFGYDRFASQAGYQGAVMYTATVPRTSAMAQEFANNILCIAAGWLQKPEELVTRTTLEIEGDDNGYQTNTKLVLRWIRDKARAFPTHTVIVIFHANLQQNGTRRTGHDWIHDYLIAPETNIRMVLNGHELGTSAEAYRATTVNGRTVHEMLSNYQSRSNGGDGWLRLLTFTPGSPTTVEVSTYSPTLDQFETDAGSEFSFNLS